MPENNQASDKTKPEATGSSSTQPGSQAIDMNHTNAIVPHQISNHDKLVQTMVMVDGEWVNVNDTNDQKNVQEDMHKVNRVVTEAQKDIINAQNAADSAVKSADSAISASKVNSDAIAAQGEAISEAKSAINSATAEIQQIAATAASDAAKIRADVAQVQSEVDTAKAANSATVEALKSDVSAAKQDIQAARQANENVTKQLDDYTKQAQAQGKTIKDIQNAQDGYTATLADIKGNVSKISDAVDGLIVFPLQQGDEVLDGERAHKLATMIQMPIPHAGGAVGSFFSGIFNSVGDAVDDAMDWVDKALKNVVEFGTEMFSHFVAKVSPKSTDSVNNGLKVNLPGFYARHLQAWLKKQLEQMQDDNGDAITPEMIRKAAAKVHEHVTDSEIQRIINVAVHESNNRSKGVENDWDSNAKAGTPSKGVLQFIQPTFDKYAVKGHHNIWKAFDQVLALLNDSNWRSDIHTGGWGPTGTPRGFANGGIATAPSIFGEAGAEMAIPLDTMKSTRAWQLMRQVVDYYAGSSNQNTQVVNQTDLTPLEKRFDEALAQNQQLINLIDKLIGVTDSANNPTARYRRTQHDINMAQAQSLGGY